MEVIFEPDSVPVVIFGLDIVGYSRLDEDDEKGYVQELWSKTYRSLAQIFVQSEPNAKTLQSFLVSPRGFLDTGDGYYALFAYDRFATEIIRSAITFYLDLRKIKPDFRAAIHIGEIYKGKGEFNGEVAQQLAVGKDLNCTARLVDLADSDNLVLSCEVMNSLGFDINKCEFDLNVPTTDGGSRTFTLTQGSAPIKHGKLEKIYYSNCKRPPAPIKKSKSLEKLIFQSLRKIEHEFLVCLFHYSKDYSSVNRSDKINDFRRRLDPRLTVFIATEQKIGGVTTKFAIPTHLRLTTSISKEHERGPDRIIDGFPGFNIGLFEGVGACFRKEIYRDDDLKYGIHISLPYSAVDEIVAAHKGEKTWSEHRFPTISNRTELQNIRDNCSGCKLYSESIASAFGITKAQVKLSPDPLMHWHRLGGSYVYIPLYLGHEGGDDTDAVGPLAVISIDVLESLEKIVCREDPRKDTSYDGKVTTDSKAPCPVCGQKVLQLTCPQCGSGLKKAPRAIVDAAVVAMYRRLVLDLETLAGVIGEHLKIS